MTHIVGNCFFVFFKLNKIKIVTETVGYVYPTDIDNRSSCTDKLTIPLKKLPSIEPANTYCVGNAMY